MDNEHNNQLCIKRLQQVLGLRGRQGWPHGMCYGCVAGSQIRDLALMMGADGACMCLDKAHGSNPSLNSLDDMVGRDWCCQRVKSSRCNADALSSRTCNTILVECLVVDTYVNIASRVRQWLASPQHMYINLIGRRQDEGF